MIVSCTGEGLIKSEGTQSRPDSCQMLSLSEQLHIQESEQGTACLIQSIFDPQYIPLSLLKCHKIYGGLCADLAVTDGLLSAFKSHMWRL